MSRGNRLISTTCSKADVRGDEYPQLRVPQLYLTGTEGTPGGVREVKGKVARDGDSNRVNCTR